MSFSSELKAEIIDALPESDCCKLASLCACINTVGSLEIKREGISFSIKTDNIKLVEVVQQLINSLYGEKIENPEVTQETLGKFTMQEFVVPVSVGNQILQDCGIISLDQGNNWTLNKSIDHHLIIEDCCKKSYLKMAFLCVGNISVPNSNKDEQGKNKSGYHFELELTNGEQAKAIANLLGEFGFISRKVDRNERQVVYMKESESIADFVGFVGGTKSYLKLQEEIVNREMRNSINRQSNCISANIDKTVKASLEQVKAIELIEDTIGISGLPESLRRVAVLRKENPEDSLIELVNKSDEGLTKSGLNYKLKRIVEIAKKL